MGIGYVRILCCCLAAAIIPAGVSHAGEELMPLVPAGSADRPAARVNVVKLTLPALVKSATVADDKPRPAGLRPQNPIAGVVPAPTPILIPVQAPVAVTPARTGNEITPPPVFSPIDQLAEIPGLITPDVIAGGPPARVTTYSAGQDDLLELAAAATAPPPVFLEPAPRRPRPEEIRLPPPLAVGQGRDPSGRAATVDPTATVAAGPGSLRPPPGFAGTAAAIAPPVGPGGPPGGLQLRVPPGLSLTATLPPGRAAPAPERPPPVRRRVPAIGERTVPEAEPDGEDGFTTMRKMRNLLGR